MLKRNNLVPNNMKLQVKVLTNSEKTQETSSGDHVYSCSMKWKSRHLIARQTDRLSELIAETIRCYCKKSNLRKICFVISYLFNCIVWTVHHPVTHKGNLCHRQIAVKTARMAKHPLLDDPLSKQIKGLKAEWHLQSGHLNINQSHSKQLCDSVYVCAFVCVRASQCFNLLMNYESNLVPIPAVSSW